MYARIALVIAALGAAQTGLAATLLTTSGSVVAGGEAKNSSAPIGSGKSATWAGTPSNLSVTNQQVATGTLGGTVTTSEASAATWLGSGLSGTVTLSDGWNFATLGGEGDVAADFYRPSWTYVFTPSGAVNFALDYAITASGGDPFGLYGYRISVDGVETNLSGPNAVYNPTYSGIFTALLSGSTSHSIELYTTGNLGSSGGYVGAASETGLFSFAVTDASAPEPATWSMMVLGVGAIGAALRRRQSKVAFTF